MESRIRPFNTLPPHRHIKVFSTPAGTPSGSLPLTGGKIGEVRLGKRLGLGPRVDHWGVLVEGQHGDGTFFELYRPDGGIGVLRRSRWQRQREEGGELAKELHAKSDHYTFDTWPGIEQMQHEAQQKDKSMNLKYTNTESMTAWTDDEIEKCARDICRYRMRGEYHLLEANCQTFVNLLLQCIVVGSAPYIPFGTISHAFKSEPSDKKLSGLSDFDKAKPVKLKGSSTRITPDFMLLRAKHNIPLLVIHDHGQPVSSQIDLDLAKTTESLTIADIRKTARFEATDWAQPHMLNLEGIRSYLDERDKQIDDEGLLDSPDDAPVIVSDHNGEERLFNIDNKGVWKAQSIEIGQSR